MYNHVYDDDFLKFDTHYCSMKCTGDTGYISHLQITIIIVV